MTRRIALLVNPTAGKGRGAAIGAEVAARLRAAGHEVVDVSGDTAEAAGDRARAAVADGVDTLVVGGGDGMVHLGVDLCAGTDVPLGIVAAGTGNDIARALGLPVHDAAAAARLVDTGRVRSIDAGRAEDDHGVVRWCVGVLGAGFDARVNERANGWSWPTGGGATTWPSPASCRSSAPAVRRRARRRAARDRGDARGGRQRPVVRRRHAGLPGRRPRRRAARRPGAVGRSRSRSSCRCFPGCSPARTCGTRR